MKKLLSLLLAVVLLAGSLIFALPVLAEDSGITLELNGGTLVDSAYVPTAGAALPTYEGITRSGYTFAGWYENADFTGDRCYVAEENANYYAFWVIHTINGINFEDVTDDSDLDARLNYTYRANNTVSLNTNSANAYDGTKSLYINLIDWYNFDGTNAVDLSNESGYAWWDNASDVVDGFAFWISTSREVTFEWQVNYSTIATVTVPVGKHIITIPKVNDNFVNNNTKFRFKKAATTDIYIDAIGSYTIPLETSITLNTYGGTLDREYFLQSGDVLPEYNNITKQGYTFAGWYKTSDYSDARCYVAEDNTMYYARWITYNINGTGFEDATDVTTKFTIYGGSSCSGEINTDTANVYEGSKSLKLKEYWGNVFTHTETSLTYGVAMCYKEGGYNIWDNAENIEEGYAFWISTTEEVTIRLRTYWWNYSAGEVTVPAGKHIITIPGTAALNNFRLATAGANNRTIYIDAIGTYTTLPYIEAADVTFETNGGTLADPDALYQAGDTLPTFEGVTKAGAIFDGWYKNADFSGDKALTVEDGATYYAKWLKVVETLDNFDSADSLVNWEIWKNSGGAYHSDPTLNTDSANAISGNNSLRLEIDYINDGAHNGPWNQKIAIAKNASLSATKNSDGLYFYLTANYDGTIAVNLNPETGSQDGDVTSGDISFTSGTQLIMIPWSTFGEGVTQATASVYAFTIKGRWHNSEIGVVYIDDIGSYGDPTVPSYGVETSEKAGLFITGQDTSTNAGISGGTENSAVYEVSGKKYVAFRVFGTYVAPAKADGSGADYGKVVVDANGTTKDIVSRHVILGYNNNEPTVDNNYAKSTVTANFENCWNTVENVDGTYTVTYSLLLKDIPQDYVGTAFTVRSAVVTAEETIYSSEVQENVSAQGIYNSAINAGYTIGWFE